MDQKTHPSSFNVVIDEACGEIPDSWKAQIPRLGAATRLGQFAKMTGRGVVLYLHRRGWDYLHLVPESKHKFIQTTEHWGPILWREFHSFFFGEHTREEAINFLVKFWPKIPCGDCRGHAKQIFEDIPYDEIAPAKWSVDFHNAVNVLTNKPKFPLSEAKLIYANTR